MVRQNGESQNRGNKKTKRAKLSKKQTFFTPWYGSKKCLLFGKFDVVLFSCYLRFEIRLFALLLTQFVIYNPWKVPWNWIVFYQNSFVISPGCYISWLDATLDNLQTRYLRQILLLLRNISLTVWKLQTERILITS